MKRRSVLSLIVVALSIFVLVGFLFSSKSRIIVANSGDSLITITSNTKDAVMILGQNGTGSFSRNSEIEFDNVVVSVGNRVEVENTGTEVIEIAHVDRSGSPRTMLLGENGTGYFSKARPITMGDIEIRVGRKL